MAIVVVAGVETLVDLGLVELQMARPGSGEQIGQPQRNPIRSFAVSLPLRHPPGVAARQEEPGFGAALPAALQ
jgi:hypothetical protein